MAQLQSLRNTPNCYNYYCDATDDGSRFVEKFPATGSEWRKIAVEPTFSVEK
jgi:hypothetical protein